MKRSVYVFVYLLAIVLASEENEHILDSIIQEIPCTRVGGTCTIPADCPKGQLTKQSDLCPQQRKLGIECCHGVSVKETRCEKHYGACMSYCNPMLQVNGITDCPKDYQCCVLV